MPMANHLTVHEPIENIFVHILGSAPSLAEYLHDLPPERCPAMLGDHVGLVLCDCCKHVAAEALSVVKDARTKRSGKIGLNNPRPEF